MANSKNKKNKGKSKVTTKEVPFSTVTNSEMPGMPSTQSPVQGTSMPSGTAASNAVSMGWPAPENWHLQGRDAAKKVAMNYLVTANQYLHEQEAARKLELAGQLNQIVESLIHGIEIGTQAAEEMQKKVRTGDESSKVSIANLKQTLNNVANTIWVHNYVALRGAPGFQIRMIDGQLVGRTVRATGLQLKDDGIQLPQGVDPDSIWLDNQMSGNVQGMPVQPPGAEEPPAEDPSAGVAPEGLDTSGEAVPPNEEGAIDEQAAEEQPTGEEEVPAEGGEEVPPEGEEGQPSEEAPDESGIPPDTEVEGIEGEQQAPPDDRGEGVLQDYVEQEAPEVAEETEETPEEEAPTEAEAEPTEETPEEEPVVESESEPVEEEPEVESAGNEPEEEEVDQESAEERPSDAEEVGESGDEESAEEPEETEGDIEEEAPEEEEENTQYCIICDQVVTQDEIDACDNPECPFRSVETEEESVPDEEQKHFILVNTDDHDGHQKYTFKSKEFTGLEIYYCRDCDKAVHYAFEQKSWSSDDALQWMQKKVRQDHIKEKSPEENIVEQLFAKFESSVNTKGIEAEIKPVEKPVENIEVKEVELDDNMIKSALERAIENSILSKELVQLKDGIREITG